MAQQKSSDNDGKGYLTFAQMGLYYAHGRWYNPDTGLWLSPNEKGDYLYGGDGQDAVNFAWRRRQSQFCAQAGMSDCERFVDEVRSIISQSFARGDSASDTVRLLAEYYSRIPRWFNQPGNPPLLPTLPGLPEGVGDRYGLPEYGDVHNQDDSSGEVARQRYGFRRIFFANTHHYFADFYSAWFWGGLGTYWFNIM